MSNIAPPPLPRRRPNYLIVGLVLAGILVTVLFAARLVGLYRRISVRHDDMTPAISPGDQVMMESVSYLFGKPHRGDLLIFKTGSLPMLPPGEIFVKRVVGEPGDRLSITNGKLSINGAVVTLSNSAGVINYPLPPFIPATFTTRTELIVPSNSYFVLGDNSTNSLDSRFFGAVPDKNVIGRVWFRYWPPQTIGSVK